MGYKGPLVSPDCCLVEGCSKYTTVPTDPTSHPCTAQLWSLFGGCEGCCTLVSQGKVGFLAGLTWSNPTTTTTTRTSRTTTAPHHQPATSNQPPQQTTTTSNGDLLVYDQGFWTPTQSNTHADTRVSLRTYMCPRAMFNNCDVITFAHTHTNTRTCCKYMQRIFAQFSPNMDIHKHITYIHRCMQAPHLHKKYSQEHERIL